MVLNDKCTFSKTKVKSESDSNKSVNLTDSWLRIVRVRQQMNSDSKIRHRPSMYDL